MSNFEQFLYLPSSDFERTLINNNGLFFFKLYKEFYGTPQLKPTEPQTPVDRYFALKKLLELPGNPVNTSAENLLRKRAIYEEIERLSEILRIGPPNVMNCPPWSSHIAPFHSTQMNVAPARRPSKPPITPTPCGLYICLGTHVTDNEDAHTSKPIFYSFRNEETTSQTQDSPRTQDSPKTQDSSKAQNSSTDEEDN